MLEEVLFAITALLAMIYSGLSFRNELVNRESKRPFIDVLGYIISFALSLMIFVGLVSSWINA